MSGLSTTMLQVAARTRVLAGCLAARRSPPVILMYHGVTRQAQSEGIRNCEGKHLQDTIFARHLRILKRSRRVVPLGDMIQGLHDGADLTDTVAITFDDGYLNNIEVAAPILADFALPAAFFMATNYIGSQDFMWTDRMEAILDRTTAGQVTMPGSAEILPLATLAHRSDALRRLKRYCKTVAADALPSLLDSMQIELEVPDQALHADASFMTWDQVRSLAGAGFEIGAHTMSHPILTQLSVDEASAEILGSRDRVRQEIGSCSTTFCFPNGKLSDFRAPLQAICREHFQAALATERGPARREELFELRRLSPAGPDGGENLEWTLLKGG